MSLGIFATYRFKRAEIDLNCPVRWSLFVEVKARSSLYFDYPESFVRYAKCLLYQEAASEYIQDCGWEGDVRFDIVSVYKKNNRWSITHFKDAFY
jgi:putative endonuclease